MLETLSDMMHLNYLSDLRNINSTPQLVQVISSLKEEDYTEAVWAEVACYIAEDIQLKDGISIRTQLLDYLENKL